MSRKFSLLLLLLVLICAFPYIAPVVAQDATPSVTARAHLNQGDIFYENGDFEAAVEEYSEAIKLDSAYVDAYLARGYTYYMLDAYDLAVADYNRAIELAGNSAERAYLIRRRDQLLR